MDRAQHIQEKRSSNAYKQTVHVGIKKQETCDLPRLSLSSEEVLLEW